MRLANTVQSNAKNHTCLEYFDGFLHWPATDAGKWSAHPCPYIPPASVLSGFAKRFCHSSGVWTDSNLKPVSNNSLSYTNYHACTGDMHTIPTEQQLQLYSNQKLEQYFRMGQAFYQPVYETTPGETLECRTWTQSSIFLM
ncbi:hypothetical protein EG68_00367 [Paragonimus skrjabini miyazakii]|uniref:G-protein coupled receptors family 2 profile 1 domain-containing protein n=1 Tax=Paragonimus skrjabini miyazakii TaxID=59628 RepID=A0A8S9Z9H7_9TREM|nr:hypothetical protein EG68_00367 [Paragonimus skrjabini miyazakii]